MKSRIAIVGSSLILALMISILSNAMSVGNASAHAAQTPAATAFDRHAILPIRQVGQSAQKVNVASASTATTPACLTSATTPRCYSPQQIRTAYGIQPLVQAGIRGAGQTVVLIDFATSPALESDIHYYDQLYGLKDPKINVISPFSTPSVDPDYYEETALDIDTVHSIAPAATIDLVLANLDATTDYTQILPIVLQTTQYAIQHNLGSVISQSFGVGESCVSASYAQAEQQVFAQARAKGISVFASSGDYGAAVITCPGGNGTQLALEEGVNLPAADPLVTAVGGTTLDADVDTGKYVSETTWSGNGSLPILFNSATGGGISTLFPAPNYQKHITGLTQRAIPDVAFEGDPATGVPVVVTVDGTQYVMAFGGTSVGSPAWAAITVLANQVAGHRLGFLNNSLYALSASRGYKQAFHDITTGQNAVQGFDENFNIFDIPGYKAGPGWDAVTGIGTPIVWNMAIQLALFYRR